MSDHFVRDVGLGRVERGRMVTNVLRREKHAARERFEKNAWLDQAGDGFEAEPAERLDLATDFVQLRNAISVEVQLLDTREILGTGVLAMRWSEGLPNRSPNVRSEERRVGKECRSR